MTTVTIERELLEQAYNALTLPCDRWNAIQHKIVTAISDSLLEVLAAPATAPDTKAMAERLMGWPLPKDFSPDCGISFDGRKDDEWNKNKTWPTGTNLLTVDQAIAMFKYVLSQEGGAS